MGSGSSLVSKASSPAKEIPMTQSESAAIPSMLDQDCTPFHSTVGASTRIDLSARFGAPLGLGNPMALIAPDSFNSGWFGSLGCLVDARLDSSANRRFCFSPTNPLSMSSEAGIPIWLTVSSLRLSALPSSSFGDRPFLLRRSSVGECVHVKLSGVEFNDAKRRSANELSHISHNLAYVSHLFARLHNLKLLQGSALSHRKLIGLNS
jgi:hypothetical protein